MESPSGSVAPQRIIQEQVIEAAQTKNVLDKVFVGTLKVGDPTPTIRNLAKFRAKNAAPLTVTDFREGQNGQEIAILGDGFMTVQHGARIKTNTAANKLLLTYKVYRFTLFDNVWYEDA